MIAAARRNGIAIRRNGDGANSSVMPLENSKRRSFQGEVANFLGNAPEPYLAILVERCQTLIIGGEYHTFHWAVTDRETFPLLPSRHAPNAQLIVFFFRAPDCGEK